MAAGRFTCAAALTHPPRECYSPWPMTSRFDRVTRSAGLLRSMKTYTLVLSDDVLYMIATGPAGRIHNPSSIPEDLPPVPSQVREAEARISSATLDAASQAKHCFKIPLHEIRGLRLKRNVYRLPALKLETAQGTFRLEFREHDLEEVEVLARALQAPR